MSVSSLISEVAGRTFEEQGQVPKHLMSCAQPGHVIRPLCSPFPAGASEVSPDEGPAVASLSATSFVKVVLVLRDVLDREAARIVSLATGPFTSVSERYRNRSVEEHTSPRR